MKKIFSAALLAWMLFISCSKQVSTGFEQDITGPVIKVVYPLDIPQLPQGYPLCMKVQISDDKSLSTVWVEINDGQGFRKDYAVTGRSMEITEKYTAATAGELSAKFYAFDESGNNSLQELKFIINN